MRIELDSIEMRFPKQTVPLFKLPSLDIASGSCVLIHGPSGAGKTTLLHLMCGQFLPHSGSVRMAGVEITKLAAAARAQLRRAHCGIIFQRGNLVDHLTVLENVLLGIPPALPDVRDRAASALHRMDLQTITGRRAGLLSPGEQQRVAIARIVAAAPDVILADEPTSSLDFSNTEMVMDALWEVSAGRTLVVVSHDPRIRTRFENVLDFANLVSVS